jgi:AraC-like DNA-binding protein
MNVSQFGEYYGIQQRRLDLPGITLSRYAYPAPRTGWHYHENPYLMLVMEGKLLDVNRRTTTRCPAGSLMLYNWDNLHYNSRESAVAGGFHVEFTRDWLVRTGVDDAHWRGSHRIEHPRAYHLCAALYAELITGDAHSLLSTELLVMQLCQHVAFHSLPSEPQPPWIARLRDLLHEEADDLSLATLSRKIGVHPVHISRTAPRYFGYSLGEYIRQTRIRRSLQLMMDSRLTLTDIALRSGFSDQSHFIRTFRRYFPTTPLRFRRRLGS